MNVNRASALSSLASPPVLFSCGAGTAMYLVCETKGTKDFLKLRTSEADKVRCGQRHFEAIGVEFKVAVVAEDV